MEANLGSILEVASKFGVLGLVIYLWWADNKRIWAVLERYDRDMMEQREMYKNNVSLCRDFAGIAQDLRDIVTLNIQKMTEVGDAVQNNQFCPLVRVDERKVMKLSQFKENG